MQKPNEDNYIRRIEWIKFKPMISPLQAHVAEDSREEFEGESHLPSDLGFISTRTFKSIDEEFNFWQADTNFLISDIDVLRINAALGVEELTPLTSYKFKIGVAKLFTKEEVQDRIGRILKITDTASDTFIVDTQEVEPEMFLSDEEKANLVREKEKIQEKKFFVMYILPNGKIVSVSSDNQSNKIQVALRTYQEAKEKVGGVIYQNILKVKGD